MIVLMLDIVPHADAVLGSHDQDSGSAMTCWRVDYHNDHDTGLAITAWCTHEHTFLAMAVTEHVVILQALIFNMGASASGALKTLRSSHLLTHVIFSLRRWALDICNRPWVNQRSSNHYESDPETRVRIIWIVPSNQMLFSKKSANVKALPTMPGEAACAKMQNKKASKALNATIGLQQGFCLSSKLHHKLVETLFIM